MKIQIFKVIKKRNVLISLFSAFCVFLIFPTSFHNIIFPLVYEEANVWKSLDPSWLVTLNYSDIKGLTWGKDFVFTYGPLGYLSTKFLLGVEAYTVIIFDLFIALNFYFLFQETIRKTRYLLVGIIFCLLTALMLPTYLGSSVSLILLLFLIFWIIKSFDSREKYSYLFQLVILFYIFYIKINTGIIAFGFFYMALLWSLISTKITRISFTFLAIAPIIIIGVSAYFLNVDLVNYIFGSFEIIEGYNQVMYLFNDDVRVYVKYIFPLIIVFIISLLLNLKKLQLLHWKTNIETLFIYGILIIIWFVVYKQAFLRADVFHVKEYFIVTSPLVLLGYLVAYKNQKTATILYSSVLFLNFYLVYSSEDLNSIGNRFSKKEYFESAINFDNNSSLRIFPNNNQLPEEVLQTIGNHPVDVYPWNSLMLLENKLNFIPRPVFQSYFTYTKNLQQLNFDYYNSNKAPKYVIYELASIDERCSFLDDTRLNMILFKKYHIHSSFTFKNRIHLLLEKTDQNIEIFTEQINEYAVIKDSNLKLEEGKLYEIQPYLTFSGKIYSIFRHTPSIRLSVHFTDGRVQEFRTSPKLLEAGIYSDELFTETKEFLEKDSINTKVKYISFAFKEQNFYKDKIRVKEFIIKNK